jgi:hypothetical protein
VPADRLAGNRGLLLRSERRGDGRYCLAVIEARDGRNGVATRACVVAVCPHDQNQASLGLVRAEAAAAKANLLGVLDSGAALPPAGLYEHGLTAPLGPFQ